MLPVQQRSCIKHTYTVCFFIINVYFSVISNSNGNRLHMTPLWQFVGGTWVILNHFLKPYLLCNCLHNCTIFQKRPISMQIYAATSSHVGRRGDPHLCHLPRKDMSWGNQRISLGIVSSDASVFMWNADLGVFFVFFLHQSFLRLQTTSRVTNKVWIPGATVVYVMDNEDSGRGEENNTAGRSILGCNNPCV